MHLARVASAAAAVLALSCTAVPTGSGSDSLLTARSSKQSMASPGAMKRDNLGNVTVANLGVNQLKARTVETPKVPGGPASELELSQHQSHPAQAADGSSPHPQTLPDAIGHQAPAVPAAAPQPAQTFGPPRPLRAPTPQQSSRDGPCNPRRPGPGRLPGQGRADYGTGFFGRRYEVDVNFCGCCDSSYGLYGSDRRTCRSACYRSWADTFDDCTGLLSRCFGSKKPGSTPASPRAAAGSKESHS